MAAERDGPEIAYQALLYPAVGVKPEPASMEQHTGTVLTERDLEWFRECYYGYVYKSDGYRVMESNWQYHGTDSKRLEAREVVDQFL